MERLRIKYLRTSGRFREYGRAARGMLRRGLRGLAGARDRQLAVDQAVYGLTESVSAAQMGIPTHLSFPLPLRHRCPLRTLWVRARWRMANGLVALSQAHPGRVPRTSLNGDVLEARIREVAIDVGIALSLERQDPRGKAAGAGLGAQVRKVADVAAARVGRRVSRGAVTTLMDVEEGALRCHGEGLISQQDVNRICSDADIYLQRLHALREGHTPAEDRELTLNHSGMSRTLEDDSLALQQAVLGGEAASMVKRYLAALCPQEVRQPRGVRESVRDRYQGLRAELAGSGASPDEVLESVFAAIGTVTGESGTWRGALAYIRKAYGVPMSWEDVGGSSPSPAMV